MMKFRKHIYGAVSLYWAMFIYGFSAETGSISGGKSMAIAGFLERVFRKLTSGYFSYDVSEVVFTISHIIRKSAHVAGFFVLAVLLFLFIESISGKRRIYAPLIFTVLYAAADEFHQSFVPGRGPSINDVGIDSCGAIFGVIFAFYILGKLKTIRELK